MILFIIIVFTFSSFLIWYYQGYGWNEEYTQICKIMNMTPIQYCKHKGIEEYNSEIYKSELIEYINNATNKEMNLYQGLYSTFTCIYCTYSIFSIAKMGYKYSYSFVKFCTSYVKRASLSWFRTMGNLPNIPSKIDNINEFKNTYLSNFDNEMSNILCILAFIFNIIIDYHRIDLVCMYVEFFRALKYYSRKVKEYMKNSYCGYLNFSDISSENYDKNTYNIQSINLNKQK